MPVKNAEKFLEECLISILNQSFKTWKLYAVDDHSSDNSKQILSKFALLDNRINWFENPGTGIIPALKKAYETSGSEMLTRMDADDIMPKTKLEQLSATLAQKGTGHIVTGKVKYFAKGNLGGGFKRYENWLNKLMEIGNPFQDIYKECVIPSACWMAFRSDLEKISAFQESQYPEDYDLVFRFYKEKFIIVPVNDVLHLWRDHTSRASRTNDHYKDQSFLELKIQYFLRLDYNPDATLVLWGAGNKGKAVAKKLIANKIDFQWVSNNEQKLGLYIYGIIISGTDLLKSADPKQIIVAISDRGFQDEKEEFFREYNLLSHEIIEFY